MAEIFVSATIQVLIEKLLSPDLINFTRSRGVFTSVKEWEKKLVIIRDMLADAEEMQITKVGIKIWLQDLQDLAYDVEDVLDEFETEALRLKLKAESKESTSKVRSLILTSWTSFKPSAVMFNVKIESKINKITTRLQEIEAQKSILEFRDNAGGMSLNRTRERPDNPPTSSLEESHVYGREKDKEAILELLLGGEASDDEVCVIPIIGMGGIGKTTLAQLVYNDVKVNGYFDTKAWVYGYEEFNLVQVTKAILDSFTGETSDAKDLDRLQKSSNEKLSKKKFLLVLDDVWHESYKDWTVIRRPLEGGDPRSRIIITTRNHGVSSMMGTVQAYHLKELSYDNSLSTFTHHALGTMDFDAYPSLKHTGEQIVKKCKGLPLAIKALGGLLCGKVDLKEWEDVLRSEIWDLPEEKCEIVPALRLSYHHLPPHLKHCFVYCSIFPKD